MQINIKGNQKPLLKDFRNVYDLIVEKLQGNCRVDCKNRDYPKEDVPNSISTSAEQYFKNNLENMYKGIQGLISDKEILNEITKIKETRNLESMPLFEGTCIAICDIASILKSKDDSLVSTITLLCILICGISHQEASWCIEDVVIYSALNYMSEIKVGNHEIDSDTCPSCFSRDIRAIKNADEFSYSGICGFGKAFRGYNTVLRFYTDSELEVSESLLNKFGNYHPYLEYSVEEYLYKKDFFDRYQEQISTIIETRQRFVKGDDFSDVKWHRSEYLELGEMYQKFIEKDFFDLSFKEGFTFNYDDSRDVTDGIFNLDLNPIEMTFIWDMLKGMYNHIEYPSFKALQKILSTTQKCLKENKPLPRDIVNELQFDTSKIEGIDWKKNDTFREDLLLEYEDASTIKECQKALLKLIKEGKTLNEAKRILSSPIECKNYSSVIGDIDAQSVAIISISCNEIQKKLSSSCIKETVSLLSKKDNSGYSSYSVGEVQGLLLAKGFPKDIVNECLVEYLSKEYLVL